MILSHSGTRPDLSVIRYKRSVIQFEQRETLAGPEVSEGRCERLPRQTKNPKLGLCTSFEFLSSRVRRRPSGFAVEGNLLVQVSLGPGFTAGWCPESEVRLVVGGLASRICAGRLAAVVLGMANEPITRDTRASPRYWNSALATPPLLTTGTRPVPSGRVRWSGAASWVGVSGSGRTATAMSCSSWRSPPIATPAAPCAPTTGGMLSSCVKLTVGDPWRRRERRRRRWTDRRRQDALQAAGRRAAGRAGGTTPSGTHTPRACRPSVERSRGVPPGWPGSAASHPRAPPGSLLSSAAGPTI